MDLSGITMYRACLMHSRAERVLKNMVSKQLESWNITRMEWLLLASVSQKSKVSSGHTMGELAEMLDVRLSQVTALVANLNENKYVLQKVAPQDRRTRYVAITSRGKQLLSDIEIEMRDAMRSWLGGIPHDQLSVYMSTVDQLSNDLK